MTDGVFSAWALTILGIVVAGFIVGGAFGCKAFNRYQARADAENRVKVSAVEIRNQEQRIQIEKQKAEIKHQQAIGQRKANEEVAKKLTPLFVQFEMIEALKAFGQTGQNNTVIYIPSGANGVPLVSTTNQPQVFGGESDG